MCITLVFEALRAMEALFYLLLGSSIKEVTALPQA